MKFSLRSFIFFLFSVATLTVSGAPIPPPKVEEHSVVVLGGGIGGLTSALYLARSGLTPLVVEGVTPGGLLTQSHSVQNWPGELEIEGSALMARVHDQAEKSGVQFLSEEVIAVDFSKRPFTISTRSFEGAPVRQIQAKACIVAMGTQPNFLNIPGETGADGYWGKGVTNCAVCDGPLYKNKIVGVVGGGDAAILEALYLSDIAKEVHVFVRKDRLKTTEKKRVETLLKKSNVKLLYNTEAASIQGDRESVTGVMLKSKGKEPRLFSLDGVFLAIGSKPNSSIFKNSLKLDASGYVLLQKDQQTSIEGVYAVGDIVDPVYKQAISAAGDGAKAALQAHQFVTDQLGSIKHEETLQKNNKVSIESSLIEIKSVQQFEKEMSSGDKLVIVDFYAPWCGPCQHISPVLDSLAEQMPSQLKVLKVNIDQFSDLSKSYQIRSVPTLLVFSASGKLIEKKSGTKEITQALKQLEIDFDAIAAQ